MELILLILSDVLCSLSCAGTIINRQAIYNKRVLGGFRKRSIILESSGICRNVRGANAKMPEKWLMTVAARIDDKPVLSSFGCVCVCVCVSEKPSKSLFFIPE